MPKSDQRFHFPGELGISEAMQLGERMLRLGAQGELKWVRACHTLARAGYKTVADVRSAPDSVLLAIHGFGPESLKLIRETFNAGEVKHA